MLGLTYKYKCTITFLTQAAKAGVGSGTSVAMTSAHAGGKRKSTYLYKIASTGEGPKETKTEIEVVASILK